MNTCDRACAHQSVKPSVSPSVTQSVTPSVSPSVKAGSITPHIDTGDMHVTTRTATSSGISIGKEEGVDLDSLGPGRKSIVDLGFRQ